MANETQIDHWNSSEADHWVTYQNRYDAMLAPFADRLVTATLLTSDSRVLDVGCGCGSTTIQAARLVPNGTATGVDISAPMIQRARRQADELGIANISWLLGDAQVLPMATAGFDAAISRFGVMFFDDPVAAFSNVARALSPGGSMTFVCWQDLFSNDWIRVPGLALAEHVPLPDLGPPGGPGLFSLADPDRIGSVLGSAGFSDVEIEPLHEMILLGGGGPLDETVEFLRHGSMARAVLQDADPEVEVEAIAAATKALQPFVTQSGVEIGTAAWLVSSRRS